MNMNQGMFDPNADRSPDMMPTQSPFMKYVSSFPKTTSTKAPANFTGASPINQLEDLSGDGKVTQKDVLIGRGVIDAPTKRLKYCGGTSKPYGKKK